MAVLGKADPMGDCKFYNNIVINSRKYSAGEQNTQPSDTSATWIRPVNYYWENNTVGQLNAADYYTGGGSGGGGAAFDIYYGFGINKIRNNIYFNCYRDKGQGISGLNYLWHNGNGSTVPDTSNNKYSTDGLSLLSDTITGAINPTGAAVGTGLTISYITTDNADITRTVPYDIGAFKYVTAGSPPSCTTNLLPVNGSTVTGTTSATLTWNAASGATFYEVYGPYLGGTPPSTPTYTTSGTTVTATGLVANSVYHYYVKPSNIYGDATGCATSNTQFSTASIVYIHWKLKRK